MSLLRVILGFLITLAFVGADRPPHDERGAHCVRCAVDAQHKDDDGVNSPRVDRSLDDDFLLTSYGILMVPAVSVLILSVVPRLLRAPPPDSLFRPPRHLRG